MMVYEYRVREVEGPEFDATPLGAIAGPWTLVEGFCDRDRNVLLLVERRAVNLPEMEPLRLRPLPTLADGGAE